MEKFPLELNTGMTLTGEPHSGLKNVLGSSERGAGRLWRLAGGPRLSSGTPRLQKLGGCAGLPSRLVRGGGCQRARWGGRDGSEGGAGGEGELRTIPRGSLALKGAGVLCTWCASAGGTRSSFMGCATWGEAPGAPGFCRHRNVRVRIAGVRCWLLPGFLPRASSASWSGQHSP